MRIPLVGPSYNVASVNISGQRTVNWILQQAEQGAKTPTALLPTPGKLLRCTAGNGPVRALFSFNNVGYAVSGSAVYRFDSAYLPVQIGTIQTASGNVGMACNGSQILIVDGKYGYLINIALQSVSQITSGAFPNGVTWCQYLDGYFVVGGDGTQIFHISAINDGTSWNGLDFASAEGMPDNLVAGIVDHRELWLFGTNSVEIWYDTGAAAFPIERTGNAFLENGCAAVGSLAKLDNSVFWLHRDDRGDGMIWRAQGYQPVRISDFGVEAAIAGYSRIDDAVAYTYQQGGHSYYVISFPTADATWVYDCSNQTWHERASWDGVAGAFHRDLGQCYCLLNRDRLVGDYSNGNIYALDPNTYTDNGAPIKRLRSTYVQDSEENRVFYQSIEISLEAGVGLVSGQGSDPTLMLRWSDNGGHTWSNTKYLPIGKIGEYGRRAKKEQLGAGRNRVWEISMTDPVKVVILGAVVRATVGNS